MASLQRIYPDFAKPVVEALVKEFYGQVRNNKASQGGSAEHRVRTVRFLGELIKFKVAPPVVAFKMFRGFFQDFSGSNIDLMAILLETCGRYGYAYMTCISYAYSLYTCFFYTPIISPYIFAVLYINLWFYMSMCYIQLFVSLAPDSLAHPGCGRHRTEVKACATYGAEAAECTRSRIFCSVSA